MPRLSIVLATGQRGAALRERVGRLLATSLDLEVLLCDDGSGDVSSLADARVRFVGFDPQRGVAAGVNALLAQSTGDFVTVLSPDATPIPGSLERAVALLDARPDVDLVHALAAQVNPATGLATALRPVGLPDATGVVARDEFRALFVSPFLRLATSVFRRALRLAEPSLDEAAAVAGCVEWEFALRLVRGRGVFFFNEPGVVLEAPSSDDPAAAALRRGIAASRLAVVRRWLDEDAAPPTLDAIDWYRLEATLNADVESGWGGDAPRKRYFANQLAQLRRAAALRVEREARRTLYRGLTPGPVVRAATRPSPLPTTAGPRCSIVIPVFNKVELTRPCVESLFAHTPAALFELIIVDNGSSDGTAAFLAGLAGRAKVITNAKNLGFARACNQGAAAASSAYVMFLNNDTVALPKWLEPLLETLDGDAAVGAVGAKLFYPDGTLQHAGVELVEDHTGPALIEFRHRFHRYIGNYPEAQARRELVAVTAAAALVRREAFEAAGGFDEAYWNGYEDMELCLRLGELGYKIVYEPRSALVHYESASGPERWTRAGENVRRLVGRWTGRVVPDRLVFASGSVDVRALCEGYDEPPRARVAGMSSIILLAYNQLRYNRVCVESVLAHSEGEFELIVVDNGSTDGTPEYFEDLGRDDPRVRVVRNAENLGFAAGCNQGVALSRGEFVVFLNNDTVVPRQWLSRLAAHFEARPDIGAVGPISNEVSGPQQFAPIPFANEPSALPQIVAFGDEIHKAARGMGSELGRLVGFCLMVRGAALDRIGGFDPQFGIGNFEDDDLCARIREAGWINWMALDTYVHHFGSRTFLAIGPERLVESRRRGWEIFKHKWSLPATLPQGPYLYDELKYVTPEHHYVALPRRGDALWFEALDPFNVNVAPRPLPGLDGVVFFHHSRWAETGWLEVVSSYLAAFTADDAVTLVLWLDPNQRITREAVEGGLANLRAASGRGARCARIALETDAFTRAELASLYRAADGVVSAGDPMTMRRAARVGVHALSKPSVETWRDAAREARARRGAADRSKPAAPRADR